MTTPTTQVSHDVRWLPWGEEAFREARAAAKLILLDSGATWCHWCHVMDRVTYEDADVVRLIERRFVAVRIDRDRLPEVDAHFQQAVPIIRSSGNGWPLTVVLTPDGHVLYKATFLPPRADGRYGAGIGLIDLLERLDESWRTDRERIAEAGRGLQAELVRRRGELLARPGELDAGIVDAIYAGIASSHDAAHGGFGRAPKFFSAPAIDVVMARAWQGDAQAAGILTRTLEGIARGGVYDHVGGGFHRYSVDERWHVPHFEKMAYDNAAMMAHYANAAALTGREDFARTARRTLAWTDRVLGGRDAKGFYASQDADVGLDDDGDYFTWTAEEVRAAVGDDAPAALSYYAVDEAGDMHDRKGRNVLHVPRTAEQVADLLGLEQTELRRRVEAARRRLLAARGRRTAPRVDRTVFADLNGMMIDAYLTVWERLGEDGARRTALRTLDHLLARQRDDRGIFAHWRGGEELRGVGLLADQAWMARALLHAHAATADAEYLAAAETLAEYVLDRLVGPEGGLLTAPRSATTHPASIPPRRSWQDGPSRSAATVAAEMLIDLGHVTGEERWHRAGTKALKTFAGAARGEWGLFLAGYAAAVEHALRGPRSLVVVGPGRAEATRALASAARGAYVPHGRVFVLAPARAAENELLKRLGYAASERPVAYVCRGRACLAPAATAEQLRERVAELAKPS